VPVGPLTNIAAALVADPTFVKRVPEVVIMGGAHDHGNITPAAEFNVWADATAANEVVCATRHGLNLTLIPIDLTNRVRLPREYATKEFASPLARFLQRILQHPFDVKLRVLGMPYFELHDSTVVQYLIDAAASRAQLWTTRMVEARVETRGEWTHGMLVVDRRGYPDGDLNAATVAEDFQVWVHGSGLVRLVTDTDVARCAAEMIEVLFGV